MGVEKQVASQRALIVTKWVGLVAAIWVQSVAGNNYSFANYSQALKKVMNLNQSQLSRLAFAKDVGKSFGVVSGLLMDRLPPWAILAIGGLEGMVGYGVQWLVVSQRISPLPYWQMCIFLCLGGNSTTWMNTACLVTTVRNFPRSRGLVVGVLKCILSLSTAIFTLLTVALFSSEPSSFLVLLSVLPVIVNIPAMIFLRPVPPAADETEEKLEQKNFTFLNVVAIILAAYLFAYTLAGEFAALGPSFNKIYSAGLLLLLALPLAAPIKLLVENFSRKATEADRAREPLLAGEEEAKEEGEAPPAVAVGVEPSVDNAGESGQPNGHADHTEAAKAEHRVPELGEDFSVSAAALNIDFWLLFVIFLCGIGPGMTAINNLGQIGESLGYTDVATFVAIVSIGGFVGRLGSGTLSEHLVKSRALPRPVLLAVTHGVMLLAYVLWAGGFPGSMYLGSALIGACYGATIALAVPTASELFGLKNFGMIYNILILDIPLGSFLFSSLLTGWLYDREASKQQEQLGTGNPISGRFFSDFLWDSDTDSPLVCKGPLCFRGIFLVMAGTCLVGLVLSVILSFRARKAYFTLYGPQRSLVAPRLK